MKPEVAKEQEELRNIASEIIGYWPPWVLLGRGERGERTMLAGLPRDYRLPRSDEEIDE